MDLKQKPITKAKRFARWLDPEDAEQIAMIGLLQAARRFKPDLGYQFATYASHWVRQSCQRLGPYTALTVHVPLYVFWPCRRVLWRLHRLGQTAETPEAREALLAKVGMNYLTVEGLPRVQTAIAQKSLPNSNALTDTGPLPDSEISLSEEACRIRRALNQLPPRMADVIRRRYGIDRSEQTLEEVGREFGITRERVRQIQEEFEAKLRRVLARNGD